MDFIINNHFAKDSEDYRKAKLFLWNAVIGLVTIISMTILTANDPVYGKMSTMPLCLPIIASILTMYYTGKLKICVDIICISLLIMIFKFSMVTGGVNSLTMIWLILSPIYALTIGGYKRGFIWAIITVFVQIMIYRYSISPSDTIIQSEDKISSLLNQIFYVITILTINFAYEFIKVKQQKTIQKQVEFLLEQRTQNLIIIQQLQIIEKALNTSNSELKSFAFAASHDLKEHIRMIGTHVQIIQKNMMYQLDNPVQNHMLSVVTGVRRMEKLLNDLIEYEQTGNNTNPKTDIDLNEIIHFAIKTVNGKHKIEGVDIQIADLPTIHYFKRDVYQLFTQLIDNVFKFRNTERPLSISVSFIENNDIYHFKIEDNGLGISELYHESVFDLFYRLNNRSEYEGSGVGLSICKKIILNLGGEIWIENTEGGGTTVHITMLKSTVFTQKTVSKRELKIA